MKVELFAQERRIESNTFNNQTVDRHSSTPSQPTPLAPPEVPQVLATTSTGPVKCPHLVLPNGYLYFETAPRRVRIEPYGSANQPVYDNIFNTNIGPLNMNTNTIIIASIA
jgi:hypothetical protein